MVFEDDGDVGMVVYIVIALVYLLIMAGVTLDYEFRLMVIVSTYVGCFL